MSDVVILGGLGGVMAMVLILPFASRWVEEELEAFLLVMGVLAVTLSGRWSAHLIEEALTEPIKISLAVLLFGFAFRRYRAAIRLRVDGWVDRLGLRWFLFVLVVGLGFLSSAITAIIAALILVEIIDSLKMEESKERAVVILTCYAIGLGAVLTPIGEPLSTIATAKLSGEPYHADFFFLTRLLWPYIVPGILIIGFIAMGFAGRRNDGAETLKEDRPETPRTILVRAGKVYLFVMALVFLGRGFMPIVDRYLAELPRSALYWINTISAVLDNATLAAAEISPRMSLDRIQFLLMGLMIAGGMLIPGNIPNIICANKLNIKSGEWAKFAAPLGLVLMIVTFMVLQTLSPGE